MSDQGDVARVEIWSETLRRADSIPRMRKLCIFLAAHNIPRHLQCAKISLGHVDEAGRPLQIQLDHFRTAVAQ